MLHPQHFHSELAQQKNIAAMQTGGAPILVKLVTPSGTIRPALKRLLPIIEKGSRALLAHRDSRHTPPEDVCFIDAALADARFRHTVDSLTFPSEPVKWVPIAPEAAGPFIARWSAGFFHGSRHACFGRLTVAMNIVKHADDGPIFTREGHHWEINIERLKAMHNGKRKVPDHKFEQGAVHKASKTEKDLYLSFKPLYATGEEAELQHPPKRLQHECKSIV